MLRPVLVATVVAGVCAAPAGAQVSADGERWAAWSPDGRLTRVLDARDGSVADLQPPTGCDPSPAVGAGRLLYSCAVQGYTVPAPVLVDIRTGIASQPPGVEKVLRTQTSCYQADWTGLGTRWARAYCSYDRGSGPVYLDLRTGNWPVYTLSVPGASVENLDVASRRRMLCSAVRKGGELRKRFGTSRYQSDGRVVVVGGRGYPLRVLSCRTGRATRLSRCTDRCEGVVLAPGAIAWTSGRGIDGRPLRLRLYDRRYRRTRRLGTGVAPVVAGRLVVARTSYREGAPVRVFRLRGAPRVAL